MVIELKCQETLRIHLSAAHSFHQIATFVPFVIRKRERTMLTQREFFQNIQAVRGLQYVAAKLIMWDNRKQPRNFLNKIYAKKHTEIYCLEIKVLIDFVKLSRCLYIRTP